MGVIFVAAGLLPIALAVGVITPKPGQMHAPAWLVFLAGCCFCLVGTVLILPERSVRLRGFLAGLFVTAFATVFLWVGFGPGERQFRSGLSIGPVSSWSPGGELSGRFVFGVAGVLIAAFAVWAWLKWLRSFAAPKQKSPSADPVDH